VAHSVLGWARTTGGDVVTRPTATASATSKHATRPPIPEKLKRTLLGRTRGGVERVGVVS
jgi:hypothetical protein